MSVRWINLDDKKKTQIESILKDQLIAVLGTSKGDEPYSCLVSFATTPEFRDVVFATKRNRLKYRNISANPRVTLTIDNRENKNTDIQNATSITIVGTAEDIRTKDLVRLSRILLEKHPNLKEFVESEDSAIIRVFPHKVYVVSDFESTTVIEF